MVAFCKRWMVCFLGIIALASYGLGQDQWEMRVCADPDRMPISNQSQDGYDNQIANILAEEMQARLSYNWKAINDDTIIRFLRTGECDLVLGVADGVDGLLSSVPYYRIPYVFAYLEDSPFEVTSLDDSVLQSLKIGTYPNGGPHRALLSRNLAENVVVPQAIGRPSGPDYTTPILEALLAQSLDLAIVFGTEAGYFAREHPEIKLVPVSPEIEPPLLQMFRIGTIGVRPGDEAFRDSLNVALAKRWDDIEAVFSRFNIPLQDLPAPGVPKALEPEPLRIGAILPMPTGNPALSDTIGKAAQLGSRMAEDLVGRDVETSGLALKVLLASSPTPEAALRAAQRLVQTEGVSVLMGGLEDKQAQALSQFAQEANILFFNLGSSADTLRNEACLQNTFHVEASAAMYLDAIAAWFVHSEKQNWYLVYEDSELGQKRYERALKAVQKAGAKVVAESPVQAQQYAYVNEVATLSQSAADVVLMLLSAEDQEFFLSQYQQSGLELPITGFPEAVTQSRDFLFRFQQVAPKLAPYYLSLWETTLEAEGADINERFMARAGEPLDAAGWSAYAAIKIIYESVLAAGSQESGELGRFLESEQARFSVGKSSMLSFRPWDHQLVQPLYLLQVNHEAHWGIPLSDRLAIANYLGELPMLYSSNALGGLELLGNNASESTCHFH